MYLWAREKGGYSSNKARQTAEQMTHESVQSIAIIRHGAIGDLVILRPFLLELREIFPNASLTLSLVDHYQYGAPIDLVDNVHVVYKKIEGKKTSFFERIKQMKALGEHDIIMDMADDALSMWTMILNKAKLKMGFPYREYRKLFLDIVLERSDFLLETENLLHFANVFGARSKHPLQYALPSYVRDTINPYICYFTSASTQHKCWPKDHFIELVRKMSKQFPKMTHILMDGVKPDEKVDDMLEALSDCQNVVKQELLGLEEVYGFLGQATMVIANDTGVRNMAVAVNTPTVGIFFATGAFRYWPRDGLHEAIFTLDATVPEVEMVFEQSVEHIRTLGINE